MTPRESLYSLADRLTEPDDKRIYLELVGYYLSLPADDELFKLVQMLGFLTIVGLRIPESLAVFLLQVRAQTEAVALYTSAMSEKISNLPESIISGIETQSMIREMSESFRQQLLHCGLRETADLIEISARELKEMARDVAQGMKPAAIDLRSVTVTLGEQVDRLREQAARIEETRVSLDIRDKNKTWVLRILFGLVVFYGGYAIGWFK